MAAKTVEDAAVAEAQSPTSAVEAAAGAATPTTTQAPAPPPAPSQSKAAPAAAAPAASIAPFAAAPCTASLANDALPPESTEAAPETAQETAQRAQRAELLRLSQQLLFHPPSSGKGPPPFDLAADPARRLVHHGELKSLEKGTFFGTNKIVKKYHFTDFSKCVTFRQ